MDPVKPHGTGGAIERVRLKRRKPKRQKPFTYVPRKRLMSRTILVRGLREEISTGDSSIAKLYAGLLGRTLWEIDKKVQREYPRGFADDN